MTCGSCPEAVTNTLRDIVQRELDKLRSLKRATGLFNDALNEVTGDAGSDIDAAVNAIPEASLLDLADIAGFLLCPLTPLALGMSLAEFSDLDPQIALDAVKELRRSDIARAKVNYEEALNRAPNTGVIRVARKYVSELTRLQFDAASFGKAALICATVLTTCSDEFYSGPYATFVAEAEDFSFSGVIPSNLGPRAASLVQKLLQGEAKFKQLRSALA